jgi:hypothetical protein
MFCSTDEKVSKQLQYCENIFFAGAMAAPDFPYIFFLSLPLVF